MQGGQGCSMTSLSLAIDWSSGCFGLTGSVLNSTIN